LLPSSVNDYPTCQNYRSPYSESFLPLLLVFSVNKSFTKYSSRHISRQLQHSSTIKMAPPVPPTSSCSQPPPPLTTAGPSTANEHTPREKCSAASYALYHSLPRYCRYQSFEQAATARHARTRAQADDANIYGTHISDSVRAPSLAALSPSPGAHTASINYCGLRLRWSGSPHPRPCLHPPGCLR